MSIRTSAVAALAAALLVIPHKAQACACCASTGQHTDSVALAPGEYEAGELARVTFAPDAHLFVGEGEPSDLKGLSATSETFALDVTKSGPTWTMTFTEGGKTAGTLSFRIDQHFNKRAIDARRTLEPVVLDKQWTVTAPVTGTGMFKLGKQASVSLLLQGKGNSCDNAADFSHWMAIVDGAGFSFHFYGDLAQGAGGNTSAP